MKPRELAYCGLFGAAALLLPTIFHLTHLGSIFMPMYLPLVALAFFVRPGPAALTSFVTPLLSGAVTGMPPFYPPVAPVMSVELALMAGLIGIVRTYFRRPNTVILLAVVLLSGRIVQAALFYLTAQILHLPASFVAGVSFINGWPGILLMMVSIPALVRLQDHPNGSTGEPERS
ncbi:MAG: ECF transporter S component [Planctomycetota bacterium]